MPTVSRSVERVFQIMGLFGSRRRPLSATEIRETLNMPHSSAVSLLSRLVSLGYLEQNADTKRYFPSLRLSHLCESVPDGIARGSLPARLVDAVHARTAETTSLSRLSDLFTLPVYVRTASYRGAHHVTPGGTGGLATQSVVGQTLLSLKSDSELNYFIQRSEYWARRARVAITHDEAQVMRSVSKVRETGYLCAFNQLLPGVGVVSYPLPPSVNGEALAITVAGPTEQVRRDAEQILETLREEVDRQYNQSQLTIGEPAG
jgi:DNA-binding IclR family transcriptional regulator